MILTCPACATSYFIPDDAMGPNGRKVRCQACGEVWRATSEEPLELTLAPEPHAVAPAEPATSPAAVDPEPESLAETPAPELPKAFRARAEQQRRLRRAAAHGIVWAGLAGLMALVLNKTRFGWSIYAIGANETAAVLTGLPARRIRVLLYGLAGLCGGLTGVCVIG